MQGGRGGREARGKVRPKPSGRSRGIFKTSERKQARPVPRRVGRMALGLIRDHWLNEVPHSTGAVKMILYVAAKLLANLKSSVNVKY